MQVKLQANLASKIWIQNKANNEATMKQIKQKLPFLFFWPKPTYDLAAARLVKIPKNTENKGNTDKQPISPHKSLFRPTKKEID